MRLDKIPGGKLSGIIKKNIPAANILKEMMEEVEMVRKELTPL